jgi:hypothetical protein
MDWNPRSAMSPEDSAGYALGNGFAIRFITPLLWSETTAKDFGGGPVLGRGRFSLAVVALGGP